MTRRAILVEIAVVLSCKSFVIGWHQTTNSSNHLGIGSLLVSSHCPIAPLTPICFIAFAPPSRFRPHGAARVPGSPRACGKVRRRPRHGGALALGWRLLARALVNHGHVARQMLPQVPRGVSLRHAHALVVDGHLALLQQPQCRVAPTWAASSLMCVGPVDPKQRVIGAAARDATRMYAQARQARPITETRTVCFIGSAFARRYADARDCQNKMSVAG